jgi:hypothetical protein
MSDTIFVNIQRRLINLYENGHKMDDSQLQRTIDGLVGSTMHMIKMRKLEQQKPIIEVEEGSEKNKNN